MALSTNMNQRVSGPSILILKNDIVQYVQYCLNIYKSLLSPI